MPEISIKLNPAVVRKEWEDYILNHPEGTVYHLPAWKEVLEQSFHYQPFYLFAYNSQQKLCGILPLFQVKSIITGNRLISLPFAYICGPIANSEDIEKILLKEAKKIYLKKKCDYLEIRSIKTLNINWEFSNYFSIYLIKLPSDPWLIWGGIEGSVRRAVNKAKKNELKIIKEQKLANLKIFYQLNLKAKKNLGVPNHPFYFLKNIFEKMSENVQLYLVKIDDKFIAGIFNLNFKDKVIYVYGASDKKFLKYRPNNLLIWQAMEDACHKGYKYFDLGRTAQDNFNLINFKKHWGAEEKKMFYYYYPKKVHKLSNERSSVKYKVITGIWKRLPSSIARILSDNLFKYLD